MARFVQICASQNDLFALDEQGDIHQYHFDVKTWVKLTATRASEEGGPGGVPWRLMSNQGGPGTARQSDGS